MAAFCVLGFSPKTFAQAVFGSIIGTVTDVSGAVIPNASVTVNDVNKGTSQQVQSNASGNFTVSRLIPGTYNVKATASNFNPAEADNVTVTADSAQQVNLQLQVGGATAQTITVTAAAPPLQTDRAEVAQSLDNRQLQSLPNVDRNFSSFTLLTPGVQRSSFSIAPTENPQGTTAINANGSNYGSLGWLLDGTDNREPVDGIIVVNPTLDSISDMRISTEDYSAEFGGAVGGFVIAQTRSGGNQFHGDAFEFRRSDYLEARNPFTQYQPDPVTGKFIPSSLYNQFGGSLGGPIKKDRAFFFLDYQGTRQKTGTSLQENVPTNLVRSTCLTPGSTTCNLSEYTTAPLFNPATGATYTGGIIPTTALAPQAIALLSALPAPNAGAGINNNYVGSGSGNNDGDQADVRLDAQVRQDIHAFGRYDYSNFRLNGAPVFGAAGGSGFGLGNTTGTDNVQNQSVALGADWAIHPNLLTDFRFGFLDYHVAENKFDNGTTPATAVGIPNLNTGAPDTSGSPTFNFSDNSIGSSALGQGFGNQGCNCPLLESEQVFQVANNWTKIVGNHSIRFGADLRYAFNLRNASDNNRSGQLTFSNSTTQGATGSGLGLASFLFGQVAQFQRFDLYSETAANRQKRGGFYAEDSWRVTPKLTLNYGVRWDIIFPETVNSPGNGGFTDLNGGVIRVAGIGGIGTNGNAQTDLTDLGGRFGFAYQPNSRMVIRGGVGQVYDDVGFFGTIFGSALTHNIPVLTDESDGSPNTVGAAATDPATGLPITLAGPPVRPAQQAIPASGLIPLPNGVNFNVRPNKLLLPRVDQYNLSVQQQVTNNMTFTLAYVGNVAERIYPGETEGFNINVPVIAVPGDTRTRDERRPYFGYVASKGCCTQDINSVAPSARANYNALQTTLEQRFSNGVQFLANYTWSRAMNYGSTYFAQDPRVEYGPNDTNRNQVFVLSGLYELPFGHNKMFLSNSNRWVDYAIGGWQLAGTTTWESGLPFTPTYAECGNDQDIDTNFASPGTSSDCRPNKLVNGPNSGFGLNVGSFNPATHSRAYFTPVAALAANGAASGPFQRPAFGRFGDIGRNSFRGPSDYFADASLFKNFRITERFRAQFQFQAFNVFNHAPLGVPNSNQARCIDCAVATTGQITNLDNAVLGSGQPVMRQLQFGARFSF
ncbi:TonB-dependent receptor [Acidisarcina polymorpha]|nr:carboxypeptidase regulatory-like domain-containing protein [Acidisarcina polymorpha]